MSTYVKYVYNDCQRNFTENWLSGSAMNQTLFAKNWYESEYVVACFFKAIRGALFETAFRKPYLE